MVENSRGRHESASFTLHTIKSHRRGLLTGKYGDIDNKIFIPGFIQTIFNSIRDVVSGVGKDLPVAV